jgi:hypothetical protein
MTTKQTDCGTLGRAPLNACNNSAVSRVFVTEILASNRANAERSVARSSGHSRRVGHDAPQDSVFQRLSEKGDLRNRIRSRLNVPYACFATGEPVPRLRRVYA